MKKPLPSPPLPFPCRRNETRFSLETTSSNYNRRDTHSLFLSLSSNRTITSVGPQLLPIAFNAEVANSGDSVSVPCSILKGDMPMDISWAFNGVAIDTSRDSSITVTRISKHLSTLSIDGVSARHAGEYACSASNLAGSVSRSATLTVNGTDFRILHHFLLLPFLLFLRSRPSTAVIPPLSLSLRVVFSPPYQP